MFIVWIFLLNTYEVSKDELKISWRDCVKRELRKQFFICICKKIVNISILYINIVFLTSWFLLRPALILAGNGKRWCNWGVSRANRWTLTKLGRGGSFRSNIL